MSKIIVPGYIFANLSKRNMKIIKAVTMKENIYKMFYRWYLSPEDCGFQECPKTTILDFSSFGCRALLVKVIKKLRESKQKPSVLSGGWWVYGPANFELVGFCL